MTIEEAIAQLKTDRDLCNFNPITGEEEPMNEDCKKSAEALDVAIKALEQVSSIEDCVSRKAIEKLKRRRFSYDTNTTIPKSDIFIKLTDIRALPPVTHSEKGVE